MQCSKSAKSFLSEEEIVVSQVEMVNMSRIQAIHHTGPIGDDSDHTNKIQFTDPMHVDVLELAGRQAQLQLGHEVTVGL